MFWRIRWEENFRHLVVYKESQEKVKKDPDLSEWTGTWRDGRPINPLGSMPENSLTGEAFTEYKLRLFITPKLQQWPLLMIFINFSGTLFTVNAWRNDALEVPYQFSQLR